MPMLFDKQCLKAVVILSERRQICPGSQCHSSTILVRVGVRVRVGGVNKKFNLGHIFQTRNKRAFILHMCIPCDTTFHMVPLFFKLVTLTLNFDQLLNNFHLVHNFQTRSELSYCVFLVPRPFTWYRYC